MSEPIHAALRPPEHRIERACPKCGLFDNHPRHVWHNPDGSESALHMDCCDCEACAQVLATAGSKRGPALIKHLTKAG